MNKEISIHYTEDNIILYFDGLEIGQFTDDEIVYTQVFDLLKLNIGKGILKDYKIEDLYEDIGDFPYTYKVLYINDKYIHKFYSLREALEYILSINNININIIYTAYDPDDWVLDD